LLTPWQKRFIAEAQQPAVDASRRAESELLKAFDSVQFRLQLLLQGRHSLPLVFKSSSALLADLKDALNSAEFLFSFGLDAASAKLHPGQPDWDLAGIEKHGHIPTLWELKVDGKAGSLPPAQWKLVDAEETGLYRLPSFSHPADPNATEAAERPSYVSGNLAKFDAGIWEYGVYAPVYRQSALRDRAVVAGLDGGGWETVCNSSASTMNKLFRYLKYVVNCDAIHAGGEKQVIFGTIDHLVHSFYSNTRTFNVFGETLARRMYQLLAPGATMHPLEDNMYLEAVFFGPARMQDLKLFIASFPDVFGTPEADALRDFCKRHGLPLAWALGGGKLRKDLDMSHHAMWFPDEPIVHWPVGGDRLLDATSWSTINLEAPSGCADKWASVEAEAKKFRQDPANSLDAPTFASWWQSLKPAGGVVRQLKGKDCAGKLDLCFGTSGDKEHAGQCLCRQMDGAAATEQHSAAAPQAVIV
jgi:hypothetical protein